MARILRACLSLAVVAATALTITACSSSAPAAAPTSPAAAPTKAAQPAQPSSAPAAQPTQAAPAATTPATTSSFPEKGRSITIVVGAAAGGANDVSARMLAPLMEKDLGVPVQVVNKVGAGWQVGLTELTHSKPDGYTIGYTPLPQTFLVYLDPDRKCDFGRKDFQPLAMHVVDPGVFAVKADSPYKTLKELVDAAKANPEKIKTADTGILGDDHVAVLLLEQMTGARFAQVHFDGGAPALTATLGGHVDVYVGNAGDSLAQAKTGEIRVLGIMDKQQNKYFPGVKTFEEQGYKMYSSSSRSISMPVGAPRAVIDRLSASLKKSINDPDHMKRMDETGFPTAYMDIAETTKYWDDMEAVEAPLVQLAKQPR